MTLIDRRNEWYAKGGPEKLRQYKLKAERLRKK